MNQDIKDVVLHSGTSILGIVCKDGIVMAGDRRATAGNMIMAKKEQKVVPITNYLLIAGTGIAADIQRLAKLMAAELKLKELKSKSKPTVKESANLAGAITYQSIRSFSTIPSIVGSLIGGLNEDGTFELFTIEPAGGVYKVEDYDANFSSGMPFILGLLERQYKKNISAAEGIELAKEAIKSSTQRDVGSGHGIDIFTITKEGIKKVVSQEIAPEFKDD